MVSLSPYSTFLDLSAELQDDSLSPSNRKPSSNVFRTQSLHGRTASGNSNVPGDDVANFGLVGTLEDFQNFTNGYNCTSSRFSSLEKMEGFKKRTLEKKAATPSNLLVSRRPAVTGSSLYKEIASATKSDRSQDENEIGKDNFVNDGYEYLSMSIVMLPMEWRFGFSVSEGSEESSPPTVDNIAEGSPAERADLLLGDEIVEVNGQSLENVSHAEVIAYIHKCIKSRSVNLQIRRKKATCTTEETLQTENIQNAYIVAVEEDAKRRLEALLHSHKLTPVDMTQHVEVEGQGHITADLHNLSYASDLSSEQEISKASMPFMTQSGHMTNGHVEMSEMNGFKERDGKKGKGKKGKKANVGNETQLIDNMLTERMNNSQNSINTFGDDSFEVHSSLDLDPGPHREMAIDVPTNFLGSTKTPPRYPSSTNSSPGSTPVKDTLKNGKLNAYLPSNEEMEHVRRHKEEIRKRNEREEQRAKEQEFLRASLRQSDKMKALQKEKHKQAGIDNTAYLNSDNDSGGFEEGYVSGRHTQNCRDYMKKNISFNDVIGTLNHLNSKITSKEGTQKLKFLADFFEQMQVQNALNVHHVILDVKTRNPPVKSTCSNSQDVTSDSEALLCSVKSTYCSELLNILKKPTVKGLLQAHDRIARREAKSAEERRPPDDFNSPDISEGGASIKIVHLEKTTDPLGATVRNDGESVIISRIVKGGAAEKSGFLHEGDEILDINGIDMKGKDINDVSEMLASMTGRITFTIYPSTDIAPPSSASTGIMHVKALFNYDPEEDLYIPCRELGLSFLKGDILHVINQDDVNWWQAHREGEEDQSLAGLIPSKSFHEQREKMKQTVGTEDKENQKKGRSCSCGRSNIKKKKRNAYRQNEEHEEILSYMEVAQYYPEPNRRRPIVLIGPPNVGRQELRQRLMESDYDRFAAAVPHTSRPIKVTDNGEEQEINGKDYYFVSRAEFQNDIHGNKFIEHGEFEKNLYGTSVDAVRQIINSGKICVLNLDPEALYMLHQTDLKPYVIFVYPPNIEKLRQIQQRLALANIKDDDLRDIIERAREMEDKFGHLFDYILVNTDMDKAFDELIFEINRIEVEPQWVSITWTR